MAVLWPQRNAVWMTRGILISFTEKTGVYQPLGPPVMKKNKAPILHCKEVVGLAAERSGKNLVRKPANPRRPGSTPGPAACGPFVCRFQFWPGRLRCCAWTTPVAESCLAPSFTPSPRLLLFSEGKALLRAKNLAPHPWLCHASEQCSCLPPVIGSQLTGALRPSPTHLPVISFSPFCRAAAGS